MKKLEDYVINIPDFPKPGIIFRDITSILRDPEEMCIRDSTTDIQYLKDYKTEADSSENEK